MFSDEINLVGDGALKKVTFLKKNFIGYFMLSILAGLYVGLSILLIYTIGGILNQTFVGYKIIMGVSFGISLSLVAIAGAELFTGNNFIMAVGAFSKKITWKDAFKLWIICFLGNLVGSILVAFMFFAGGFLKGNVGEFIVKSAEIKMTLEPFEIFIRAVLCNILVCLATWCGYRCKSESGKLIMIFWCLFGFITSGYEHSVANMTILTLGLINPMGMEISFGGALYNLSLATLGNMVGGVFFLALPYLIASKENKQK